MIKWFRISFFFFFFLESELACHVTTFLILKKLLATLAFSIQYLTAKTILTQGWKVKDQFDTIERLETNLTQEPKIENQIHN
jgi:hypothetical protein